METKTKLIVRYAETDKMGIVHHSNYPIWFEAGRTAFIKEAGMQYSLIEDKGLMLPLIKLECSFYKPAFYEDEIIVRTKIEDFTPIRLTFSYGVFRWGDDELIVAGKTFHVWTGEDLKPLSVKKHSPEVYDLIIRNAATDES